MATSRLSRTFPRSSRTVGPRVFGERLDPRGNPGPCPFSRRSCLPPGVVGASAPAGGGARGDRSFSRLCCSSWREGVRDDAESTVAPGRSLRRCGPRRAPRSARSHAYRAGTATRRVTGEAPPPVRRPAQGLVRGFAPCPLTWAPAPWAAHTRPWPPPSARPRVPRWHPTLPPS